MRETFAEFFKSKRSYSLAAKVRNLLSIAMISISFFGLIITYFLFLGHSIFLRDKTVSELSANADKQVDELRSVLLLPKKMPQAPSVLLEGYVRDDNLSRASILESRDTIPDGFKRISPDVSGRGIYQSSSYFLRGEVAILVPIAESDSVLGWYFKASSPPGLFTRASNYLLVSFSGILLCLVALAVFAFASRRLLGDTAVAIAQLELLLQDAQRLPESLDPTIRESVNTSIVEFNSLASNVINVFDAQAHRMSEAVFEKKRVEGRLSATSSELNRSRETITQALQYTLCWLEDPDVKDSVSEISAGQVLGLALLRLLVGRNGRSTNWQSLFPAATQELHSVDLSDLCKELEKQLESDFSDSIKVKGPPMILDSIFPSNFLVDLATAVAQAIPERSEVALNVSVVGSKSKNSKKIRVSAKGKSGVSGEGRKTEKLVSSIGNTIKLVGGQLRIIRRRRGRLLEFVLEIPARRA